VDRNARPTSEYRYWLYDPLGDGMVYFRTEADRDEAARDLIPTYMDDGWAEEVESIACGEVTHSAQCLNKVARPDRLSPEGFDDEGEYWGDWDWKGNYTLEPLLPPQTPSQCS
jgi:hypothetical protein